MKTGTTRPALSPPAEAAALYVGHVMHARMKPFKHRFRYRVFSFLVDLDRLPEADRMTAVFSVGRFNLLSFHPRDHGPRDGSELRPHVDKLLQQAGFERPVERILLLCYPRILGWAFNPLSVFYCLDSSDEVCALVYEVRNTFGEIHSYVAPVRAGEKENGEIRQERDKLFFVSPFLDMALRYNFRLKTPGDALRLRILEIDRNGPVLAAAFSATREPFTTWSLIRVCAAIPLLTLKIVGGIHWEALKIWIKGAKIQPRPLPPGRASYGEQRPTAEADGETSALEPPSVVRPHS